MKIAFLGTASASVTEDRDNVSILTEVNDKLVLMDCSGNPAGKLLHLGYDPNDLDFILITHLHIDHCYGLPTLLFHMFLNKRTRPIHLMAPAEEIDSLNAQLASHSIEDDVRSFKLIRVPVHGNLETVVWETESVRISASPGEHSRFCRAYKIEDLLNNDSVIFSGDTRPMTSIKELANNSKMLIHEATYLDENLHYAEEYGHCTAREAAEIAESAGVGQLVLIHFELYPGISTADFKREAEQVFKGNILIPQDFDTLEI